MRLPTPLPLPSGLARRRRWLGVPGRCDGDELLDRPGHDPAELAANLRDIRRLNRWFGGVATTMRHLTPLLAAVPSDEPVTVLDLATGSGDIPLAILRWARANGRAIRVTASDVSEEVLAVAARYLTGCPEISLARLDARAVPLPDGGVDVVLCSLALHHFPPADAVRVLREMDRLARRGFVVNDLARGRIGYWAAWLASRLTTTNRLTRHDAPLSVRRAYTPDELAGLLDQAGVRSAVVTRHLWFRMAAVKVVDDGRD
jgi:ubiquinone/menaquinone biosynthesis C-methylase UbiE